MNDNDRLAAHLRWLAENDLRYHFDDTPEDIVWAKPPSDEQMAVVVTMNRWAWDTFGYDQIWEIVGEVWADLFEVSP